ncbi:hypothetical protein [Rhodococcus sp. NPDC058521]|uniref:TPR repeat region-containing protein n=1 Tax=Rhodococcus sp. NPDC058521 TaxID=3346536 RepID=UPI003653EF28
MTRTQINSWNPAGLTEIGSAWMSLGSEIENLFTRYVDGVTKVSDAYWEGVTAEAAQDRANADKKTAVVVVDVLEALATRAKDGFHEVDAPLQRARHAITGAEAAGFRVSENLTVTDSAPDPDEQRVQDLRDWQREITDAATATQQADQTVKDALNAGRGDLRAKFTSVATLGADQGRSDAADLAGNPESLTPEQIARITEAATLTPEQLDALESGSPATIPASQMEYLNQLSRSLDGKSPQEIQQLIDKLPPDTQRSVANSFQLVSNEKVTASVKGDSEVPTEGGVELLPAKMKESLTRDDLVVSGFEGSGYSLRPSTALNGVADNQAIAEIVGAGDPEYKAGSSLDHHLMDVGRQYLDAQVAHEQNPDHKFNYFTVDGKGTTDTDFTEGIFQAVGDDKIAVHDPVTNPEHGQDFVSDVLTHNWSDDGKAASTMFQFGELDSSVQDPNNASDVATATRTGDIMEAVARGVSSDDAWKKLSEIPEANGQSAGQLNPELLRSVSHSMAPYMTDLAGGDQLDKPGFDTAGWIDPEDNNSFSGSSNVFAFMNTDAEAGESFTRVAIEGQLAAQGQYALDPRADGAANYLDRAGRLSGLIDNGLSQALQAEYDDEAARAKEEYDRKSTAYGAITSLGAEGIGRLPGGSFINAMVGAAGDPLKESIIGQPPEAAQTAELRGPNFTHLEYNIVNATPHPPADWPARYDWAFDSTGNLLPWSEIKSITENNSELTGNFTSMFNELGAPGDGNRMRNAYGDVILKDG